MYELAYNKTHVTGTGARRTFAMSLTGQYVGRKLLQSTNKIRNIDSNNNEGKNKNKNYFTMRQIINFMRQIINFRSIPAGDKNEHVRRRNRHGIRDIVSGMCMAVVLNSASLDVSAQSAGVLLVPTTAGSYVGLGGHLGFGFYVSEKSYLLLDAGIYRELGGKEQTGTFSYQTSDKYGNIYQQDNGIIERGHTFIPIVLNWNWDLRLSDNVSFHIGPSIGETVVRAFDRYTVNGKGWEPDKELGEKSKPSHSKYMGLFGVGANADFCFIKLTDGFVLGAGYRYLWNGRRSFENEIFSGATHQITLKVLLE
ncbi:MAG: hypothetical protein LBF85_01950 [Tannerella sp.]|jgi:hypothetical protein|nr:hypothetical protein [Tannerella sp.]